jgi:hypothetical protein
MINPALIQPSRFGWGKIVFGTWMLFSQIGAYFHLVPDGPIPLLKPDNATQAACMHVTSVVLSLVFLYLIFRGVRAGLSRRQT